MSLHSYTVTFLPVPMVSHPTGISSPSKTHTRQTKMTQELTAYLLAPRYTALNQALYGPETGSGERTPALKMISGQTNLKINVNVTCYYESNVPVLVATEIDKAEWELLCHIVHEQGSVKAIFEDGEREYLAELGTPGRPKPRDGGVEVRVWWKEDEVMVLWEKGIKWVREKLR